MLHSYHSLSYKQHSCHYNNSKMIGAAGVLQMPEPICYEDVNLSLWIMRQIDGAVFEACLNTCHSYKTSLIITYIIGQPISMFLVATS